MSGRIQSYSLLALVLCCVLMPSPSFAVAIAEIKDASAEAKKLIPLKPDMAPLNQNPTLVEQKTARLEEALRQGQSVISSLESQVETLRAERVQLVQIQTALTSGLIAALVTAVVAIAGAIINSRNSRPDRDLKRLSVLEKAEELRSKGIGLPQDIRQSYL